MKIIKVLIILLISSFSYYGVVDDNGEKVTNIQAIMQEQKEIENIEVQSEEIVAEEAKKVEIDVVEESKTEETPKEEVEIKKVETKEKQKVQTAENEEKEEKRVEQTAKKTPEKTVVQETVQKNEEKIEKSVETIETIENKQEEKIEKEKIEDNSSKCSSGNHAMSSGNTGMWFKTKEEAIAEYKAEIKIWGDKWTDPNDPISDEEYYSKCPYGYEIWTCPYCNMWTLNYYYD